MALYSGIDIVAVASFGVYTETYGDGFGSNLNLLFMSRGLLEGAPPPTGTGSGLAGLIGCAFRRIIGG